MDFISNVSHKPSPSSAVPHIPDARGNQILDEEHPRDSFSGDDSAGFIRILKLQDVDCAIAETLMTSGLQRDFLPNGSPKLLIR